MSRDVRLAVLIGIDAYQHGVPGLRNAERDVRAVGEVLRHDHGYSVQLVVNEEATRSALKTLFADLAERVSERHRLIVYFAGHGIALETDDDFDGPQGFILPQDARRDDVATFLPMRELQQWLLRLEQCPHLLLFLDCCFAGAFRWSSARSLAVRPARLYKERFERYARDPAWQVITSAAHDETALDTVAGGRLGRRGDGNVNSPFAAALCEGLKGAADLRVGERSGDGIIVANELHLFLESRFAQLERQGIAGVSSRGRRQVQQPMLWSIHGRHKGQFFFIVPGHSPELLESALALDEHNNPYRGLEHYEREHGALFFGRQQVILELCSRAQAQELTVVLGVSGSGKSSLVRAGLVPHLGARPEWRVLPMLRPGPKPVAALSALSAALGSQALDFPSAVTAACQDDAARYLLLVVDQLEELVTLDATAEERVRFFQQLGLARRNSGGRLRIVMTLRSDFEPHFAALLAAETGPTRFPLRPLNREELREVIEGPAIERVLYFEPPRLVTQLIDEVADMPGALPLLSFALHEMYRSFVRRGPGDRTLRHIDIAAGGVAGALSRRADEIYASLDDSHRLALRYLMLRMVALEGGERARRRVMQSELRYESEHAARVKLVLDRMLAARLLVSGTDTEGKPYFEPAHDMLVLGWPMLAEFLKAEQELLPLLHRLTQAAREWVSKRRDARHLWAGDPRLLQGLALLRESPERFTTDERTFLHASESRRRQQQRITAALVVAIIVALSITTVYALDSRQRALQAQSSEREQRLRAEAQERQAVAARATAELSQYRAQIRAATAAIAANQLPNAYQLLLNTNPANRGWEWAYLLARTGPRPMSIDEFPEADELRQVLAALPEVALAEQDLDDQPANQNSGTKKTKSPEPARVRVYSLGMSRFDNRLTAWSGTTRLLTINLGAYGAAGEPKLALDESLLTADLHCGDTNNYRCETERGDALSSSGTYAFGLPPISLPPPVESKPLRWSAAHNAFSSALEKDHPSWESPFEQWLTYEGRSCAVVMEGYSRKALWQLSPPLHLRSFGPDDTVAPPQRSENWKSGDKIEHASCLSADQKKLFGFPIGVDGNAIIFDMATGKPLVTMMSAEGKPATDIGGAFETRPHTACYFSPSGRHVVRTMHSYGNHNLEVWDAATGAALFPRRSKVAAGKETEDPTEDDDRAAPLGVAWAPSGDYFAVYKQDRSLDLYDQAGGHRLARFKNLQLSTEDPERPFPMSLSPDRKRLLIGTYLIDLSDMVILLELSATVSSDWRSFTATTLYSLAFWDVYHGRAKEQPLRLRERLLLWQIKQADAQRAHPGLQQGSSPSR